MGYSLFSNKHKSCFVCPFYCTVLVQSSTRTGKTSKMSRLIFVLFLTTVYQTVVASKKGIVLQSELFKSHVNALSINSSVLFVEECPVQVFEIYAPMCANNGKTYSNIYELKAANCDSDTEIKAVSQGPCEPLAAEPSETAIKIKKGNWYNNNSHLQIKLIRGNYRWMSNYCHSYYI